MDRQSRSDPKYAEEIISTLWPNKQMRLECLQFLLNSIRFAHSQGSASWEVTLFEDLIRLNVGQIAVLSLWAEEAHAYCLATLHLPKQSGIRLDTDWKHFDAIPEPTEAYRVDTNSLDTCPKALRDAHFSLIRIAATRKPHSPFKGSFSDGILTYLEKEFDTSIDRPTYIDPKASEPTPSELFTLTEEEFIEDFERQLQESSKVEDEIRRKRLENAPKKPETVQIFQTVFKRNTDVIAEVMKRANGFCEACGKPAPFLRARDGKPYLEIHHKVFLADKGEDTVENAVALCPNCHREMHFGVK